MSSNVAAATVQASTPTTPSVCSKHSLAYTDRDCPQCVLESITKRTHRTIPQIMAGCVTPSWERERL